MVNSCKKICPAALGTLGGTLEDAAELGGTLGMSVVLGGHNGHEEAENKDDESFGEHILN